MNSPPLVATMGTDGLVRFIPVTSLHCRAPMSPPMKTYPILGFTLYKTIEVFCDKTGEVYKQIDPNKGTVKYHNRFNGWHSERPISL